MLLAVRSKSKKSAVLNCLKFVLFNYSECILFAQCSIGYLFLSVFNRLRL